MAWSQWRRQLCLTFANILIPLACLVFATGFFPYKPFLPGLATFDQQLAEEELGLLQHNGPAGEEIARPKRVFDKVIFMVVDALRSDFVYGNNSGFQFTQSLIRDGAIVPYTAHAAPPTVTMPRVKGLTTGSVPSFVDLILNFAESDTSSSLATQDTWLAQIKSHLYDDKREGRLIFYGDDTWLKLFPNFFAEHDGTSSFFVSDFTEVDNNVTRHLPETLARSDWDGMIMHYLGLDHIGHKTGPEGPNMPTKQVEMDSILRDIYTAIETQPHLQDTVLVLAGDHGMNSGGNHGGSAPGETSTALLFASPKLKASSRRRPLLSAPDRPKQGTEFDYYRKIQQSDLVPAICALLGLPFSRNNLGVVPSELLELWHDDKEVTLDNPLIQLLYRNSLQVLNIVKATYGDIGFTNVASTTGIGLCSDLEGGDRLSCLWQRAQRLLLNANEGENISVTEQIAALREISQFLEESQDILSTTASTYNVPRLVGGTIAAIVGALFSYSSLGTGVFSSVPAVFFTGTTVLYGIMMFASSYVEEEQHFWYWTSSAWFAILAIRELSQSTSKVSLTLYCSVILLGLHRLAIRWNQTGQKHAGAPDISRTFFPSHTYILWTLVICTYGYLSVKIARQSLSGLYLLPIAIVSTVPAIIFKLNFAQADAPELVGDLGTALRELTSDLTLIDQARMVFGAIGVLVSTVVTGTLFRNTTPARQSEPATQPSLASRLHPLLTLFLLTQTRVNNIPLFLIYELQLQILAHLIFSSTASTSSTKRTVLVPILATTALLTSYTTFFAQGGSNAISSIDLSNAYNGISGYNIGAVGILLFAGNWAGAIWWTTACVDLLHRIRLPSTQEGDVVTLLSMILGHYVPPPATKKSGTRSWIEAERLYLAKQAEPVIPAEEKKVEIEEKGPQTWFLDFYALMTLFMTLSLAFTMAACTALRTHLFIWTVFSPKFLYGMAWGVGWHGIVVGLMGGLWWMMGY